MQNLIKYLRILDIFLGIFVVVGIGLLFLVGANNWDDYWPLPEEWNWYPLLGAFGLYVISRVLSWIVTRSLRKSGQTVPSGRVNNLISVLVMVGVVAILAVVFSFVMALGNVGSGNSNKDRGPAQIFINGQPLR